jgi:thiamine biosynthesis lipoprotein
MGCQILALLDADTAAAKALMHEVPHWFAGWEMQLSRFRDDSELMRLNTSAGHAMNVSQELWEVIEAALAAEQQSDGLVTPTLLCELERAGYRRSWDEGWAAGTQPISAKQGQQNELRPVTGLDHLIERDAERRLITLHEGVRLDLGGIAKGWAVDRAVALLGAHGPALVDAGGDIAVSAPLSNGQRWPIGVSNPFAPAVDVDVLLVGRGGVATSGRDYRRWQREGAWYHHIIDPRSGEPAQTNVLSASVVAPTASRAEVAAKVALILGSVAGKQWIETQRDLAALLILEDGQIIRSERLHAILAR